MEEAAGGVAGHGGDDDGGAGPAEEVKVYCAVGKDAGREWKANLRWVLANFPRSRSRSHGRRLELVLAHVHRPPRLINMMGAWVPASQLDEREVVAFRWMEEDKAKKALDGLVAICKRQGVHVCEVVVVVGDDVAGGLLQLVEDHGVAELVMGAAADRAYTRKMRTPRSKKAVTVQREASPSCRIWFVCKGNLVCTREREVSEGQSRAEPSTASTSPRLSSSNHSTSKSSPLQGDDDGGQPLATHDPTSLRWAPSRNNGTDDSTEDSSGHEAAAETAVVAEVAFQPEPPSSPSRHGSEDATEMDGALHEEPRRRQQDRWELDAISEKTEEEDGRSDELDLHQVAGSGRAMGEFDVPMSESCSGREEPAPEEGSMAADAVGGGGQGAGFLRFRFSELEEATSSFDESARIGGGRGGVYRGTLRGMGVAVRIVSPDVAVNKARFARAVAAMARARHPGLVTPVGACPEAGAVVEELVPGGSLEDRLDGEASPLPWHARCGVAYRTYSALAYLHSTATVHGDVRAANILFEDERCASSKLAGLGASRLAAPKKAGRVALAYVDPRYLANGELTPQCDVHALGVLLLRLVTGKPAFGAKKAAREVAAGRGRAWSEVSDVSAGGWPTERAKEVAVLGLKCCAVSDGRVPPRPAAELLEEARSVLEAVTSGAPGRTRPRHVAEDQPEASHDEPVPDHTSTPSAPPSSSGVTPGGLAPHSAAGSTQT